MCLYISAKLYGITSQKPVILIFTLVLYIQLEYFCKWVIEFRNIFEAYQFVYTELSIYESQIYSNIT
jgi:hypothetical protein